MGDKAITINESDLKLFDWNSWSLRIIGALTLILMSSMVTLLVVFFDGQSNNALTDEISANYNDYDKTLASANKRTFNQFNFIDAEELCLSTVKKSYSLEDRIHVSVSSRSTMKLDDGTIKVFLEIPTTRNVEARSFSCLANTKKNMVIVNSVTNPDSGSSVFTGLSSNV